MGERLFSPKSMERVVRSVEWEDILVVYKDGTTNQERFMQALAELEERWMRGWSFPDLSAALLDLRSRDWLGAFTRLLRTFPERVFQLKGFYEGLWYGANPRVRAGFGWPLPPEVAPAGAEQMARNAIGAMLDQLRLLLTEEEEESNAW